LRHPLHLLYWHAVAATKVAVVGQRDPQVIVYTSEGILKHDTMIRKIRD
jgi:hypothetical protein